MLIKLYEENGKQLEAIVKKANDDIQEVNQAMNTKKSEVVSILTNLTPVHND